MGSLQELSDSAIRRGDRVLAVVAVRALIPDKEDILLACPEIEGADFLAHAPEADIRRASEVDSFRSLSAPVVISPMTISSAARPPNMTTRRLSRYAFG